MPSDEHAQHKINVDFYDDWDLIVGPSELNATQKNLLLFDDCFLGRQNKADAYYTRGRHNKCETLEYLLYFHLKERFGILIEQTVVIKWGMTSFPGINTLISTLILTG